MARIHRQGASQVGALLHAARQLVRVVVLEPVEPDPSQPLAGDRQGLRARHLQALQTVGDVAERGAPGQERRGLEDQRSVPARSGHRAPGDEDRAPCWREESIDEVEKRCLAAPGRAHDRDELIRSDGEVDLVQYACGLPESWLDEVLADAAGFYPRQVRGEGCGGAPGRYHRDAWGRGPPGIQAGLDAGQGLVAEHAEDGDQTDADEHLFDLECRARPGDEKAKPGGGDDELAHHHADQGAPDPEPESGDDEWQAAW